MADACFMSLCIKIKWTENKRGGFMYGLQEEGPGRKHSQVDWVGMNDPGLLTGADA